MKSGVIDYIPAGVAELVYAYVSEAYGESLESSNLSSGTNINI